MLRVKNIKKSYKTGDFTQHALEGVSIDFRENEFVAILGPSGSGKTTLLNIIGGLDRYDSGDLVINDKSTKQFKNRDWDSYRNNCIGFIFQSYNLITHISVLDNVEMALTLSGVKKKAAKKKALELLKKVGLKDHAHKKPNQLSGGQMQRVAIARALANDPQVILADEPTGALDSKTSVQIMELIKEIAKDKLVIMVTHNPDLAKDYATRIIELQDGKLLNDSNPYDVSKEKSENITIRKTKMNFLTALKLSFNNIKTKMGRTLITAFASSIGIIGIALILSLSNGFQIQIDDFEKGTLAQMPISIEPTVMDIDKEAQEELKKAYTINEDSYTKKKEIYSLLDFGSLMKKNNINDEYVEYLEKLDQDLVGGVSYIRALNMNLLHKNVATNEIDLVSSSFQLAPLPETLDGKNPIIEENFDLLVGKMPEKETELLLLIDKNNSVSETVLKALGYDTTKPIKFNDILSQEFQIVLNDDFYTDLGRTFMPALEYNSLYDKKNNLTLKIVGIIRGKEGSKFGEYSGTGITYRESLAVKLMELNNNSKVVEAQRKADYNILTGEKFMEESATSQGKNDMLAYLGAKTSPYYIQIYPKDFNSKDKILEYLDKYNDKKGDDEKVSYVDYAKTISSLSSGIMNGITAVLIAFSGISLVVSSIMIGIIMYISVLERTKEIGILKALGARNKDISRVFNAETLIIGVTSGLIGLGIAIILTFPINVILKNITDLSNVARLHPVHAVILIIVSVSLTLIGGYIPAKVASKKDAVIALRTE